MVKAVKIRLLPTPEQEQLFWKSAGVARWAYNYFLGLNEELYHEHLLDNTKPKSISEGAVRKHINNDLKPTTHKWLKEVGSNVMKQAVKDADLARKRWFKGLAGKPKFKSKHRAKPSFYVNYESLKRTATGFQGEKIGDVKTAQHGKRSSLTNLPKLKKGEKYSNPRISFDGRAWYLSVGYEVKRKEAELSGEIIGIDVGIKELAVVSTGKFYRNINKDKRARKLKKRLRREQRKLSRKQLANIKKYKANRKPIWKRPLSECKNIQKQNKTVNRTHRKIKNIRTNHLHQTSCEIVKTKPSRIVMEDLNVRGMMKNRYKARAIGEQSWHEFRRQMKYKSEYYGIEFAEADRWYPSSKKCSNCGNIKKDLKLKERTYKCVCGFRLDRDLNAAINLAHYINPGK